MKNSGKNLISRLKSLSRLELVYLSVSLFLIVLFIVLISSYTKETAARKGLENKVYELEEGLRNSGDSLVRVQLENEKLKESLMAEKEKNKAYSSELDKVTDTIESFQRLSEIDPELLQKYSKVYFLNENYEPSELTRIDTKYLFDKSRPFEIHDRVLPFLREMLDAAKNDGITIQVISAYRSFKTQAALKSAYKVTYGAGTANQFSADQGYSEHQLGTALDFTTPKLGTGYESFGKSDAYKWLQENAHRYGFILSYPQSNSYYVFEPWHWRFVGLDLALRLHNEKKHFYDLDQRDISSYLRYFFNSTTTNMTNGSAAAL